MSEESGKYNNEIKVTYSEITWYERLHEITKNLPAQIPLFATVTVAFWGVAEVISEIGGESLSLQTLAVPGLLTAFSVCLYKAIKTYVDYVPEVLSNESLTSKKIFHQQKSGWQFALAREMLLTRINNIDRKLRRTESGAQFISPTYLIASDYLSWLKRRPEILLRLIHSVAVQCTNDLPEILGRTTNESSLSEVLDAVEQLSELYQETANFELDVRSVVPEEEFSQLHKMTFGWSAPIREGIAEFISILDSISKLDVKRINSGLESLPDFNIKINAPKNMEAFADVLRQLAPDTFHKTH